MREGRMIIKVTISGKTKLNAKFGLFFDTLKVKYQFLYLPSSCG